MDEKIAAQPELYAASVEGDAVPTLKGGRCRACGYVFFPPQHYGCEVCGALPSELESVPLRGSGVLNSFATVHHHAGKGIETPFTIGLIVLNDGPAVRATLTARTDEGLRVGDQMRAVLVAAGASEDGKEIVELRFAKGAASR